MSALGDAIAQTQAGLAAVHAAASAPSAVGSAELLAALVDMQSLLAQGEAANAVLLARVDLAQLPTGEHGRHSTAAAVAAHAHTNPRITRAVQRRGLWLVGFPVVGEAFTSGSISQAHVDAFRAVENPRTATALLEAQDYLVQAAVDCPWDKFQRILQYWVNAADPDGDEPDDQLNRRSLSYKTNPDGTVDGRFILDPLAGHAFTTALDRIVQRLWRQDQEAGSTRTASQRRADALTILIGNGAANPESNLPGAMIHIVMSQTVADYVLASLPRTEGHWLPTESPLDPDDIDGRCELMNGMPLHPRFAAAAMATAQFRRLIFSTDGEILEHGRKTRIFPAQAKQALLVKARGRCQESGCDAPITWLQADHYLPWGRGGPTDIANGQILCSRHNHLKRDQPPSRGDPPPGDARDPDDWGEGR
ncbi:MAG: DUF222 domain-containing protein [Actinomycetia bacterium]|nr:DUF222 domain-containing protein [Actinomycetes bacterium]